MIRLIGDYVIQIDENNFTLAREKKGKDKSGKDVTRYRPVGYYGSLEKAIEACRREYVRQGLQEKDTSLPEALNTIRKYELQFQRLLAGCFTKREQI